MTDLPEKIEVAPDTADCNSPERGAQTLDRLARLVRRFGMAQYETGIRRCLDLVCRESLQAGAGWSSLNADGTPLQIALSLAPGRATELEFVGESFRRGMEYAERRAFGLERMTQLAQLLGLGGELDRARPWLEAFSNAGPEGGGEDPDGAFWMGTAHGANGAESMVVYANARRGAEAGRTQRLAALAGALTEAEWSRIFAVAEAGTLRPLGAGMRMTEQRPLHIRVYFGAYGVRPCEYRRLFREAGAGERFDAALALFLEETLGAESAFPTRSAVFSFGSDGKGAWSPKLELCGHCLWRSDEEAEQNCGKWLERTGTDATLYRDAVTILKGEGKRRAAAGMHAYVGIGLRHEQPYASIYLNPGREDL